ncbi:MAG: hypothetical protein JWP97_1458 [Labilithrix sp.]|nr:hypothetical protein [Labilithrix sp.]
MSDPFTLDETSLLVEAPGTATLDDLERMLARRGYSLGLATARTETVAAWLAAGAPGAASGFADPSDHLVAGLRATLVSGRTLEVRPGPRRAVGPDLAALLVGAQGRFGTVDHAWLRIHRAGARRPSLPLPRVPLDPPVSSAESRLLAALDDSFRSG